jgi:hypothetical protein
VAILYTPNPNAGPQISVHTDVNGQPIFEVPLGDTLGTLVCQTLRSPANAAALFTVPASTTFTGLIVVIARFSAAGSVAASAATGGVIGGITSSGASPAPGGGAAGLRRDMDVAPVTVAGGGGGNAITAVVSGSPLNSNIVLIGYYQ